MPEYEIAGVKVQFPYQAYGSQIAYMAQVIMCLKEVFITYKLLIIKILFSREPMLCWNLQLVLERPCVYFVQLWLIVIISLPQD